MSGHQVNLAKHYKLSLIVISVLLGPCLCYSVHNYAPKHDEYQKSSDYSFSYGVKDLHTGDIKHQWEKKTGDSVKGHYSLVEPDGSIRSVDYIADKHHGFNAVVKHSSPGLHPTESKEPVSHSEILLKPKTVEEDYEYKLLNTIVHPSQSPKPESEEDKYQYQYQTAYTGAEEEQKYDSGQYESQSQEDGGGDTAETFLFFPPEESSSGEDKQESESQRSTVKTEYNSLVHYTTKPQQYKQPVSFKSVPQRQQYQVIKQHTVKDEEVDEGTVQDVPLQTDIQQPFSVEYQYPLQEQTKLPVVSLEVNFSKPTSNVGLDETYLNPVSIDLSKITSHKNSKYQIVTNQPPAAQNTRLQHRPSELTQQELEDYLKSYSQAETANTISQPSLETGFKPITSASRPVTAAPSLVNYQPQNFGPGTFKSNKKPKTTPGLRHYATKNVSPGGKNGVRFQPQIYPVHRTRLHKGLALTHQVPKEATRPRVEQQQFDFDHLVNNNKFITYKHVAYEH